MYLLNVKAIGTLNDKLWHVSFLDWLLHKCSMDVLIMFCSNMLTHWTRVEIVCAVLWCYGCVRFPLPYAKCKVYEDMQVARCLCNFPLSPSE